MSELSYWLLVGLASFAGLSLGALVLALLLPIRVHFHGLGRGEPSGLWALGGGLRIGPRALSAAAVRGAEARVQVHLFKRLLLSRSLRELFPDAEEEEEEEEEDEEEGPSLGERYRALSRHIDPYALIGELLRGRRHIRLGPTEVELSYSFRDVALTGTLYGALCAFAGFLPEPVVLDQRPSWEGVDRASLSTQGSLRIWLGRALLDLLLFLIKNFRWRLPTDDSSSIDSSSIDRAEKSYG